MISFSTVETDYNLKNKLKVKNWVKTMLEAERKVAGNITYVFCNDEYLGSMNEKLKVIPRILFQSIMH